jgi:hypothetical protein
MTRRVLWRARCVETRTPGSEGGLRKRTVGNDDTAPWSDPYVVMCRTRREAESRPSDAHGHPG